MPSLPLSSPLSTLASASFRLGSDVSYRVGSNPSYASLTTPASYLPPRDWPMLPCMFNGLPTPPYMFLDLWYPPLTSHLSQSQLLLQLAHPDLGRISGVLGRTPSRRSPPSPACLSRPSPQHHHEPCLQFFTLPRGSPLHYVCLGSLPAPPDTLGSFQVSQSLPLPISVASSFGPITKEVSKALQPPPPPPPSPPPSTAPPSRALSLCQHAGGTRRRHTRCLSAPIPCPSPCPSFFNLL